MTVSKELSDLLKVTAPEVQQYVSSLQAENLRLAKRIGKLEAELTTSASMLEAAKRGEPIRPMSHLSDEELERIAKGEE